MKKRLLSLLLVIVMTMVLLPTMVLAVSDTYNGDWSSMNVTLKNTNEAELMVRVGDIDALNDQMCIEDGYSPFTAKDQNSHDYPWEKDNTDPAGTDRIYVGSKYLDSSCDGYSCCYDSYKSSEDTENAYGEGAMTITMNFDASGLKVKSALLQLCIDDFQALSWNSKFTVTLNGKDAPFIAELLNQVDQTGPTAYIISSVIPSGFYEEIASGQLIIKIDETTGIGDGYAVDFAKLLVNYNDEVFTGKFYGRTLPGATVRLLGTSTTVTATSDGSFEFKAIPGLNAVRASKSGYVEGYNYGIVLSLNTEWKAEVELYTGTGTPDIDFSQFAATEAWANASAWATEELAKADELGLIPDILKGTDMTKPITREEFCELAVLLYEKVTAIEPTPASPNPFTDTTNSQILKAYALGITTGTSATTFSPNTLINREQCATMLFRAIKAIAPDADYNVAGIKDFPDQKDISSWAVAPTKYMSKLGIIKGNTSGYFMPKATTSAQTAAGYGMATREAAILMTVRTYEAMD